MKTYEEILAKLQSPPPQEALKTRKGGGGTLTYIKAHACIEMLNLVFGHDNWGYTTELVSPPHRWVSQDYNNNDVYHASCHVKVRLSVLFPDADCTKMLRVDREDVGYGHFSGKTPEAAEENVMKEAVSDAIKRCARTFGDYFGNNLYDDGDLGAGKLSAAELKRSGDFERICAQADLADSEETLSEVWRSNGEVITSWKNNNPYWYSSISDYFAACKSLMNGVEDE